MNTIEQHIAHADMQECLSGMDTRIAVIVLDAKIKAALTLGSKDASQKRLENILITRGVLGVKRVRKHEYAILNIPRG